MGSSREKAATTARAVAMYLARRHTRMSFPEIGRAIGHKNHSTVIAAGQRVEALLESGELVCWKAQGQVRHQVMADIVHDLEAVISRPR
jgi:chromosomal replication initiation ATPase DnaA